MIAIGVQTTQVKILFFDWIGKGIWQKALKTDNQIRGTLLALQVFLQS